MITTIIISILTFTFLILSIIKNITIKLGKYELQSFYIVSLIGALLMILFQEVTYDDITTSISSNNSINPIKILILFISLSMISISLDELGFFKYIAIKSINKVNGSQYKLFFILYGLIAILTVFTSNDIIILSFTMFIIYFSKNAKINPIPFLVMEFVVANTYSMALIIGNPTNIYLATFYNISFIDYFSVMIIPTLIAGITSLILLFFIFKKKLNSNFSSINNDNIKINHPLLLIINLVLIIICTILLSISNYLNLSMWAICLFFAIFLSLVLIIYSIIHKEFHLLKSIYKRIPYSLIVFILSMYIIILALDKSKTTYQIANILNSITSNSIIMNSLIYGYSSALFSNVVNNIPMTILFSNIISYSNPNNAIIQTYSTIIGSNIGAYLSPVGALAGIMWMNILKTNNIEFKFASFIKYGFIISMFTLLTSIITLTIILM